MITRHRSPGLWLTVSLLVLFFAVVRTAQAAPASETGYLAIAADRGFQGNEEIRDAFDAFAAGRNGELVVATDQRTRAALERALAGLVARGAKRVVVLPVFLSEQDPRWVLAKGLLVDSMPATLPLQLAPVFGASYFAVEALAVQLRGIHHPQQAKVVVVGFGADSPAARRALEADGQRIAEQAAEGLGFAGVRSLVWYDGRGSDREARRNETRRALTESAQGTQRTVVVPFHLGRRLDSMMSFDVELRGALPKGAELHPGGQGPESWLATWMTREANRSDDLQPKDVGVIVLAHGSDHHWNDTMCQAVQPLAASHPLECVFSMADQPLIERGVRRLEKRGVRAAVIVRVFGLESSFKSDVQRMIGADIEGAEPAPHAARGHAGHGQPAQGHGGHGGHRGHDSDGAGPMPRIRSSLALTTAGGLDAHPLFAQALLDRAKALSREPVKETVILVAHGTGEDERNRQWLDVLGHLATQIKAGPVPFRAVRFATWREDWPDKRSSWVKSIRDMVQEAGADGGRAIVIPARTNGTGPERSFLEGLRFDLGEGFAPHPLFARWVQQQVDAGMAALRRDAAPPAHQHAQSR